jgi:hypothetical protein
MAPSSHCSPALTIPSPQRVVVVRVHGCPGTLQAHPDSTWQEEEQPSLAAPFPSSQASTASILPLPQTAGIGAQA